MTVVSTLADAPPAQLRDAADRIARWLQDGPAQRPDGAVAGWVDAGGRVEYVYPEITGYYLQWLATRDTQSDEREHIARRAMAAQRWLGTWLAGGGVPATRLYVDAGRLDWRNGAIFCFDLAMVLRGLGAAARAGLLAPDAAVVEGVCAWLSRMIAADGELDACLPHAASDGLPDRWSTRRGAFLAKAAVGIIDAGQSLPAVPPRLREAAERTFDASIDALLNAPHAETHPTLYAMEGFLSRPRHPRFARALPAIAAQFDSLLQRTQRLGRVPETRDDPGQLRLDIVAQTLRAGVLLAAHGHAAIVDVPALRRLADTLRREVTADGALPFAPGATPVQFNVWTGMFAAQALAWACLEPREWAALAAAPLIV